MTVEARAVHVRDSKDRPGPEPALSPTVWTDFVGHTARH
ncbi:MULTISPECIES: DUF397 domain-containing protein [unclassified Streptomyces]|nr:DUF397 domain-containing protein [Streptomyces sp. HSG2]